MPGVYAAMDLLVHPAPEEVFGLCLVEAMACGVPVVAHEAPRLRYVVGRGGWLTFVTQPGFLSTPWPEILAGLPAYALRARLHVERTFSWQAVYPQYMAMYRATLDKKTED